MIALPVPPGRYAVTRRRSPAPGCEGERVYAEAQPVTLHALVSDGQRVMALVEHVDGHFETVREVDLHRVDDGAETVDATPPEHITAARAKHTSGDVRDFAREMDTIICECDEALNAAPDMGWPDGSADGEAE